MVGRSVTGCVVWCARQTRQGKVDVLAIPRASCRESAELRKGIQRGCGGVEGVWLIRYDTYKGYVVCMWYVCVSGVLVGVEGIGGTWERVWVAWIYWGMGMFEEGFGRVWARLLLVCRHVWSMECVWMCVCCMRWWMGGWVD